MNKIVLLVCLIVIGLPAFASGKKKKQSVNEIVSITMNRTPCYGRCPVYAIEITKDGTTIYTAKLFNSDTGIFRKNIGSKKAAEIFDRFAAYKVDTCSEVYENRIHDIPGLNFTIKYKNRTQKIQNANFGPHFLTELAEIIDEAGRKTDKADKSWKKTGMPKLD